MIQADPNQLRTEEYLSYSNNTIGILALSLGATALQFDNPSPYGWLFLVAVLLSLRLKQGKGFRSIKQQLDRYKGVQKIQLIFKLPVYLLGTVFLFFVAVDGLALKHWMSSLSFF